MSGIRDFGWVMPAPKCVQQLPIGDNARVILHTDGFRIIANAFISWITRSTAGIAYAGSDNPIDAPELRV